jgi:hypothetical protein
LILKASPIKTPQLIHVYSFLRTIISTCYNYLNSFCPLLPDQQALYNAVTQPPPVFTKLSPAPPPAAQLPPDESTSLISQLPDPFIPLGKASVYSSGISPY